MCRVNPATSERSSSPALKVPAVITTLFWVVKLLTTAMGESTSDFFVHAMNPYLAVTLGAVAFCIALALQLATKRYATWAYWTLVTMVAVFGTMVADASRIVLGIPYWASTSVFAAALLIALLWWHRSERTLSIHTVYVGRRELFYWATVSASFALGTALGDMTARTLGLGYLTSAVMFAVLFVVPFLGRRYLRWNGVFAFWFAYILTRPLGASFADWLGFPPSVGGIGIGHGPVAIVLTVAIVLGVFVLARREQPGAGWPTSSG